jgi:hypothetical protein
MNELKWQHFREATAIVLGATALFFGIFQNDPAMMTVGAGLIGFMPATRGLSSDGS